MKAKKQARKHKSDRAGLALAVWLLPALLFGQSGVNTQLSRKLLQEWASPLSASPIGLFTPSRETGFSDALWPHSPKAAKPPMLNRWDTAQLPFFCRIEHNLGKKTNVPFKFRLGSVEYVDWLEGKCH